MQHDLIKVKIIELACEEKARAAASFGSLEDWREATIEITLADVLRAIGTMGPIGVGVSAFNGEMVNHLGQVCMWNLTTDYDGQTQEAKNFIGRLLNV